MRLGRIGYGIQPSKRQGGLATWALGRMLDQARELDLNRVLIIFEADKIASAKTDERRGVLEVIRNLGHGTVRRYRITIGEPSA
jgi:predicted acetyltransferase